MKLQRKGGGGRKTRGGAKRLRLKNKVRGSKLGVIDVLDRERGGPKSDAPPAMARFDLI